MSRTFVIAGTDTDVGKTVFAAALCGALQASYWKPIQCGLEGGGDIATVRILGGLARDRIMPEVYRFATPASPHFAAEIDGVEIDVDRLATAGATRSRALPTSSPLSSMAVPGVTEQGARAPLHDTHDPDRSDTGQHLVIEGAGGLMVPLTRTQLQIDLFARWKFPVILCARTALGTINHSLLSIEALQRRHIPIHGIAFIGDGNADSERTICEFGSTRRLGRLPFIEPLDKETLAAAFAANFRIADFL